MPVTLHDGFVRTIFLSVAAFSIAARLSAQPADSGQMITVDQAVQEALAKNLDLASQRYSVSVAEASRITAALRPNPVLTVSGQTLNILGADYSPTTPLGPNQLNIHTDFPMERGHKREERIAVASENKSLAELGVKETMRQVIYSVQSAYVDVQQAKANLQLAQDNLDRLRSVVAVNQARLRSGDLAQVELDRSQIAELQYETAVAQAELQLDQAKTQLQVLLGRKQRTAAFDVAPDFRKDVVADSQPEIARQAIARRPDYLLNQEAQARSRADLLLQLANGKIDYSIGTEYTHQRAWGIGGNSLGVYFSMPLPVFNRNQGEIARAQREIAQAGSRIDAAGLSIGGEVEKAYRQYSVSKTLLQNVETNMLSKARSVRDTTEYSYRRGEASLVEFLDAQRAFNDTMQTYNEARASYARSLYLIDSVSAASISGV